MDRKEIIKKSKRIVIKIGSGTITGLSGKIDNKIIENIANDVSAISGSLLQGANKGKEILIVTSGAIASGIEKLKLKTKPDNLPLKQAAAAVGQNLLMHIYEEVFSKCGFSIAQILLTKDDFNEKKRFVNAKNTILTLLEYKVIPIINENDTVAVEEIKFGDNDHLSFLVSDLISADLLIILSDVDGLYKMDPKKSHGTKKHNCNVIKEIKNIKEEMKDIFTDGCSDFGTGGMKSKITAAKNATSMGIGVVIANGKKKNVLTDIINCEETGTFFFPQRALERDKIFMDNI